ncbi:MAG TPA: HIT domain-containing protein [Candidatus Saccharimonadia bacterium]|nr:HIT domain-containing protein [Candidatus Saccharimonadia bacterium]
MEECIFCSIANGDPSKLVWHNKVAAAFNDIHPDAPVHALVVPKKHLESMDQLNDPELAGQLLLAAREVAHQAGIRGSWRLRVNTGAGAGQVVNHLHFHVMGTKTGEAF